MIGRGLVLGMPVFLTCLSVIGTAAMIWVGGGIVVHGLEVYGFHMIGNAIHDAGHAAAYALPAVSGLAEWIVIAAGAGLIGLLIGGALIPTVGFVFAPAWKLVKGLLRRERMA